MITRHVKYRNLVPNSQLQILENGCHYKVPPDGGHHQSQGGLLGQCPLVKDDIAAKHPVEVRFDNAAIPRVQQYKEYRRDSLPKKQGVIKEYTLSRRNG